MSVIIAVIFLILFLGSFWVYWQKAQKAIDVIIADDVANLAQILNTIDKECGILSFEHTKNNIDFLNVIAFEGSEVGPMNLKNPKKWRGAYLKDNPTIQEKYYQVIKTKRGYWVAPGDGVALTNGLIIGKDIIFDENTDMQKLAETILRFNDKSLTLPIMTNQMKKQYEDSYDESIARDRLRNM